MADEDDQPLDLDALDWPAVTPTAGFAERTTAAFFDETAPETPIRAGLVSRAWLGVAVAAAAAVLLWVAWPTGGTATRDSLRADAVRSVAVGDRAIAVAQPGTVMRWEVDANGETRVEQDSGRVFYRVDKGGAFEVKTPAGRVTVTGTCFDVETTTMNGSAMNGRSVKSAAIGAALAAAVVVTVYEGGVVLATERGQVDLAPGERGIADASAAPRRFGDDDDAVVADAQVVPDAHDAAAHVARQARALEAAREAQIEQEKQIEALRQQVVELGGEVGAAAEKDAPTAALQRARRCAAQGRGENEDKVCSFLEPDQDTLLEMARCATVKIDYPSFLLDVETPVVDDYARRLGLTDPADVARMQAAADKHYSAFQHELREAFVALGGDVALAEQASANTLMSFIADQVDPETRQEVQRAVAEERAGLREPPPPGAVIPIEERAFRMSAELGNDFERHMTDQFGPDRARELRRKSDGWPGSTSMHSGDCKED